MIATHSGATHSLLRRAGMPTQATPLCLCVFLFAVIATSSLAVAQTDADEALRHFPKNAWYDKQTKQLIPPAVELARDEPLRHSGNVAQAPPTAPTTTSSCGSWWDWNPTLPDLSWLMHLFPTLVFSALGIVLLVVIGILTYYSLRNYTPRRFQRKKKNEAITIDAARMVDLPFEVQAMQGQPLEQAEALMQAGNFDAAIVFLYGYLLLALDQSRRIHLQKGKTNRMYWQELRGERSLREILQQAMHVFEACYFGKHPVLKSEFMQVWERVDEFHQLLHASQPVQPAQPGVPLAVRVTVGWWLLSASGCSSWLPELVPFGSVTAPDVDRSLNGLGLHREMWEANGARCLTPQKLSPKLYDMDVIVLVGQSFEPPGKVAREWLEDWLASEAGRTVIYFGRDFNADIDYRRRTLSQLAPEKQQRGAELLALGETEELNLRLRQLPASTFCGWFYLDTERSPVNHTHFIGPWAQAEPQLNDLQGRWPVRVVLQPPNDRRWQRKAPPWSKQPPAANALQPPGQAKVDVAWEQSRSQWNPAEINSKEEWEEAVRGAPESETLLAGERGQPLLFRLTSERLGDSQILIVANGAPLLNGSLVLPFQQRLGELLIDACLPARRVALLAFDESGLMISNVPEQDNRAAGLEMLTVWPLSGITMPAALLGIIVCASLLPILGRPQSLVRRSVSDFGLHIEAIGRMLYEARDARHAKQAISEYFRKVRGEPPPEWLDSIDSSD